MRKLLLATTLLAGLIGSAAAEPAITVANLNRLSTMDRDTVITAVLAEYLTTCGGKATAKAEAIALKVIGQMRYADWLKLASVFHIVRAPAVLDDWCENSREVLDHYRIMEPIDYSPVDPSKPVARPPGDLDLAPLNRRIP